MKEKRSILLPIIILAILIILACVFIHMLKSEKHLDPTSQPTPETTDNLIIDIDQLEYELQNIGKLCTAEYNFCSVENVNKEKIKLWIIPVPGTASHAMIKYSGVITAGIDIQKAAVVVNDSQKLVTVTLPKAEITSKYIDHQKVEILDEQYGVFNKFTLEESNQMFVAAEKAETKNAINAGLLQNAEDHAKAIIMNLLNAICSNKGYSVEVTFQE